MVVNGFKKYRQQTWPKTKHKRKKMKRNAKQYKTFRTCHTLIYLCVRYEVFPLFFLCFSIFFLSLPFFHPLPTHMCHAWMCSFISSSVVVLTILLSLVYESVFVSVFTYVWWANIPIPYSSHVQTLIVAVFSYHVFEWVLLCGLFFALYSHF